MGNICAESDEGFVFVNTLTREITEASESGSEMMAAYKGGLKED